MNEQPSPKGIEWTRIRNADGTTRRGYTSNPVGGCHHACRWQMPSGQIAICYAETVAKKFTAGYPQGFEPKDASGGKSFYWHPKEFEAWRKLKEPAGIFVDSMSDLMGHWIPDATIQTVLDAMTQAPQHVYQLLTKNAPRLTSFTFPSCAWVGASTPPDFMFGKRLDSDQQTRMLERILKTFRELKTAGKARITWLSAEPLSWDCSALLKEYADALDWIVIGAASNGAAYYPPDEATYRNAVEVLDAANVPIFLKGNMRSLPIAAKAWREEFPAFDKPTPPPAPDDTPTVDTVGTVAPTTPVTPMDAPAPEAPPILTAWQRYPAAEIERDLARFRAGQSWDYPSQRKAA